MLFSAEVDMPLSGLLVESSTAVRALNVICQYVYRI